MDDFSLDLLTSPFREAFIGRGFKSLAAVQRSVLDPALRGRDLRISSQTGSGKTGAIGLVLGPLLSKSDRKGVCAPSALVITPTRELAMQVRGELTWLLEPLSMRVLAVTGGTSVRAELRALSAGAEVVVATPGRLRDHLDRGSLEATAVRVIVLDEADQMLDLGFRDELDAIFARVPEARQTLLVSATFSREVLALADKYQRGPIAVQGTRLGAANTDISHRAYAVLPQERDDAIVNLLLLNPDDQALIFVRTRAETADLAQYLIDAGFAAAALSGDMEQRERTRTLDAFRAATLKALVATDVAARGIDVPDVARVIHADMPADVDSYTHRSGRTGRAGRKGESVLLVSPKMRDRATRLLRRARVEPHWGSLPTPEQILRAADERLYKELMSLRDEAQTAPAHVRELATRLLADADPLPLVEQLLGRIRHNGPCLPRPLTAVASASQRAERGAVRRVPFLINWGERNGADPRRVLAMVCRRGNIQGKDVGVIQIGPTQTTFEVASEVAREFAETVCAPDMRGPRLRIEQIVTGSGGRERPPRPTGRFFDYERSSAPHGRGAAAVAPSARHPHRRFGAAQADP